MFPDVKDKDGNQIDLVSVKSVKLKRGGREVLESLPWYSNQKGEWFVERPKIAEYIK